MGPIGTLAGILNAVRSNGSASKLIDMSKLVHKGISEFLLL